MRMEIIYRDLGQRQRGDRVAFELSGTRANVMLLDGSNFSSLKIGRSYRPAAGGLATRSPVVLAVPRSGHWYAVVQPVAGRVRASISLLPSPMRPVRSASLALGAIQQAAEDYVERAEPEGTDVVKDVFIAHAGEDKDAVVRPLAKALDDRGVAVWYDEWTLQIGDNLHRKINAGLGQSRFGVVVLSAAFFSKPWPQPELDGLVTRELTVDRQLILPVWHGVTHADVVQYSAPLANKLARDTSVSSIDEIADEIASVVG